MFKQMGAGRGANGVGNLCSGHLFAGVNQSKGNDPSGEQAQAKNNQGRCNEDATVGVTGNDHFLGNELKTISRRLQQTSEPDDVGTAATLNGSHDLTFGECEIRNCNKKTDDL